MTWTPKVWEGGLALAAFFMICKMQGILLNRLDELVELYCVLAPHMSRDEIVHLALIVVNG